jgi:hypothetical protein
MISVVIHFPSLPKRKGRSRKVERPFCVAEISHYTNRCTSRVECLTRSVEKRREISILCPMYERRGWPYSRLCRARKASPGERRQM